MAAVFSNVIKLLPPPSSKMTPSSSEMSEGFYHPTRQIPEDNVFLTANKNFPKKNLVSGVF
jgi:hypothetical protein